MLPEGTVDEGAHEAFIAMKKHSQAILREELRNICPSGANIGAKTEDTKYNPTIKLHTAVVKYRNFNFLTFPRHCSNAQLTERKTKLHEIGVELYKTIRTCFVFVAENRGSTKKDGKNTVGAREARPSFC